MPMPAPLIHARRLEALLTRICPTPTCLTWRDLTISLYWSCPEITKEEWIASLLIDSHAATGPLDASLTRINIRSFFTFFPWPDYHANWPRMRLYCPGKLFRRRALYDMAWSILVTGTAYAPPLPTWFDLDDREKAVISDVSRHIWRSREYLQSRFGDPEGSLIASLEAAGFLRIYQDRVLTGIMHRTLQKPRSPKEIVYTIKSRPGQVFRKQRSPDY